MLIGDRRLASACTARVLTGMFAGMSSERAEASAEDPAIQPYTGDSGELTPIGEPGSRFWPSDGEIDDDQLMFRAAAAQAEARVMRERARVARTQSELLREVYHLQLAIQSRDVIGQAKGILMERQRITAERAFDVLRERSQHLNVKLFEIAEHLSRTGELR